jgi:hypothetical protein
MNSLGYRRLAAKVLFTSGLAVGCIWYLADAASQSTNTANLLLILPATLIAVVLCVAVIVEDVVTWRRAVRAGGAAAAQRLDWRVPVLMAVVGLYVLVVVTVGLADLATFVFVAVSLVLLGERRPAVTVTYSATFTVAVVGGLKMMLSYDVATLLF